MQSRLKKHLIYSAVFLLVYIIEAAPHKFLTFFGTTPDLIIICVVLYAIFEGEKAGAILGLVIGLLCDVQSKIIGFNAIQFMILGYITGVLMQRLLRRNVITSISLCIACTFLSSMLTYIFFFLLWGDRNFIFAFLYIILLKAALSIPFSALFYNGFKYLKQNVFIGDWEGV